MDKIRFGTAYYNEYLPYERLEQDVEMMKKAGINTVRIAESTWSTCEPQEGAFDFSHVIRVMDAMEAAGIDVVIGTPTYAVPSWMEKSYPEILAETEKGRGIYGARQIMDITHPAYLFYAERVIRKLMECTAYRKCAAGFQLDNETKYYGTAGKNVQRQFVKYLRGKFGDDLNAMNAEFGLDYWSNRVNAWEDFPDVRGTVNGSLGAEFAKFQRILVTRFLNWQADIVNEYRREGQFITHNLDFEWRGHSYGIQPFADHKEVAKCLTTAGCDIYHPSQDRLTGTEIALCGDIARCLKQDNYLVLETAAQGFPDWTPYKGQLRLQAYSHLASGACGVEYWHWHSIHNAIESYWKGILSHNLKENATYRECMTIGADFKRLSDDLIHLKKRNRIAMIMSNRSNTAFRYFPAGTINDQNTIVRWLYDAFYRMNLEMDLISDTQTDQTILADYDLILLPSVYSMTKSLTVQLDQYVKNGGHLLAAMRSAFADEHLKIYADDQPYGLTGCFGMTYDQFTLPGGTSLQSDAVPFAKKPVLSDWMELLIPADENTETLVRYDHPYWKEYAAVTHHAYGNGSAAYLGCFFDADSLEAVLRTLMKRFGIAVPKEHFPLIRKEGVNQNGAAVTYFFNYSGAPVNYTVPYDGTELTKHVAFHAQDTVRLEAWDVHILRS